MKRYLLFITYFALLLNGCAGGSDFNSAIALQRERVIVLDNRLPPGSRAECPRLLAADLSNQGVKELTSADQLCGLITGYCPECPVLFVSPDRRTLIGVHAVPAGRRRQGDQEWDLLSARVLRIDGWSGKVSKDAEFARSGLGWGWFPAGLSADGRYLYLDIPWNPLHAEENPLHAAPGIAAYDLAAKRLLGRPITGESGWRVFPSADGQNLFVCCWVQDSYPYPGIDTVSLADGTLVKSVLVQSPPDQVHPTRIFPSGDGQHFYALRPDGEWWLLAPIEGNVVAEGNFLKPKQGLLQRFLGLFSVQVAYAKGREYETAMGQAVVDTGRRLYSSLYLGVANAEDGSVRYKSGGGIAVVDLTDFSLVKILAPEVTWGALTLSQDGRRLYALDSESAELRVFDTRTLSEIARLSGIGKYPARIFLIPAP